MPIKLQSDTHDSTATTGRKCTSGYGKFIKKTVDGWANCPFLTIFGLPRLGTRQLVILCKMRPQSILCAPKVIHWEFSLSVPNKCNVKYIYVLVVAIPN